MANNIDKKEPVAICDQSKIDVTKCDNHELAGNIEPLIKVIRGQQRYEREYSNIVEKPNTLCPPPNGTNFYKINGFQVFNENGTKK